MGGMKVCGLKLLIYIKQFVVVTKVMRDKKSWIRLQSCLENMVFLVILNQIKAPGGGDGYIDYGYNTIDFVIAVFGDSDKLIRYLFGDSMIITGNDNSDDYSDRMYVNEGEEVTKWGTFTNYGGLKPEFDNYEIYTKGN